MANDTGAFGLRPVRMRDGTPWNGAVQKCYISGSYATALFVGDPVVKSPAGTSANLIANATMPTIQAPASVASGTVFWGVIVGFEPNQNNLSLKYSPASTEGYAYVAVATPELVFHLRDDGTGTPDTSWPGCNTLLAAGSGNTATGLSGYALDADTAPTTTQAHSIHILGLADLPNNTLADYAVWEVIINTSQNATGTYLGVDPS